MDLMFLTQVGGILKPFAWIMGIIMNAIYELVSLFDARDIGNLAICVIIFTFVTKMLMLPLTIKQQKSTKLSSRMNPEVAKIQEKYRNKRDEVSMRKQQAELQAVYDKYGTTPMAGCLPFLISLPIMFALYRVIYAIPAYVNDIYAMYGTIAEQIRGIEGYGQAILSFIQQQGITVNKLGDMINTVAGTGISEIVISEQHLVDIMYQFNTSSWEVFQNTAEWMSKIDIPAVLENYKIANITVDTLKAVDTAAFAAMMPNVTQNISDIISVNTFLGGLNILDMPGWSFPGVIIPVLAAVSQFIQSKVSMAGNKSSNQGQDATMQSMKMMNYFMPVMSLFFCAMLPICVGLYWIASSVFGILQTIVINKYMEKIDIEDLIEQNAAKAAKKKKKMGIDTGSKMAEVARTSTKSIVTEETKKFNNAHDYKNNAGSSKGAKGEYKRSEVSYSAKSISANANLLRNNTNQSSQERDDKKENQEEK